MPRFCLTAAAGRFAPLALAAAMSLVLPIAQAQANRVLAIAISAQPLAQALNELARQAGLELIVQPSLVAGRTAPAVSGPLTAQQALEKLLAGSGLQATFDGNAVVIKPIPTDSETAMLPVVKIQAQAVREDAHGAINGYAARLSATATKTDTPILETPQSISVVGAEQVVMQGSQSVSESLRYTAGITYSVDTTQDEITLRGFSLTGGGGSIYRDGSKLPLGGFNGKVEPYGLERLEVLKGASSVLYGFVQPGGLVNLVTKRPTADLVQELNLSYGSHDRKQVSLDLGGALGTSGEWSWRLTGLARRSQTFQDHVPDDRTYIAPALKWQPSATTSLTFLAQYQSDHSVAFNQLPLSGVVADNPNGPLPRSRYTGEPGDYYKPTLYSFGTLFEHAFSDDLKLRNSLRFYRARFDMHDSHGGGGGDYADDGLFRNLERQFYIRKDDSRVFSADTSLEYKFATGAVQHTALVGLDYARQVFIGDRSRYALDSIDAYAPHYGAMPGAFDNGQSWHDRSPMAGLYVQDQMKIDQRWVVLLGGRQDWWRYESTDYNEAQRNNAFTGRAGVVYLADNGFAPFASVSQSFEPNAERDRLGNRYVPTTGKQFELGLRYQPANGDISLSAALYQLTQNEVLTPDPVDPDYSVQTGAIRSRGIELEARGKLSAELSVIASYAYNHNGKPAVEEALIQSGMQFTFLQPGVFFQNMGDAWPAVVEHGVFAEPFSARSKLARVDYRDVAEVAALALTTDALACGTFELVSGENSDREHVVRVMSEVLQREIKSASPSFEQWAAAVHLPDAERPVRMLRAMYAFYDKHGLPGNPLTLRALLGREPRSLTDYFTELAQAKSK